MIRAVIVDDEENSRSTIRQLLEKYYPAAHIVAEAATVDDAFEKISATQPDVVLLDVEMPRQSGFDLLRRLPDPSFAVVFITAYDQYALRAIKQCALDYLLKPVNIEELVQAMDKVVRHQHRHQEHIRHLLDNLARKNNSPGKIALPSQTGLEFISISRIVRCEASGSYTTICTDDKKKLLTTRSLKEYEQILPEAQFFRPHHSHIINLEHIRQYHKGEGGYVVMSDGSSVDIAKRRKKDFLERFGMV